MALNFNGSTGKILGTGAAITGVPATIAAWVRPDITNSERTIAGLSSSSSSTQLFRISMSSTGKAVAQFRGDDGAGTSTAIGTTTLSTTALQSVVGTFVDDSGGSRATVYLNGSFEQTLRGGGNPTITVNQTDIGVLQRNSAGQFWDGDLAEIAMWDAVLDADEIAAHAKGISPLLIRPQNLVFYAPLVRSAFDYKGRALTTSGSPSVATHPRIYMPGRPIIGSAPAATAPSVNANLTGVAATAAAGTLGKALSRPLTGQVGAAAAGTLGKTVARSLSGEAASAAAGDLGKAVAKQLAGQGAAAAAGTVARSVATTLIGVEGVAVANDVTATGGDIATVNLSGVAAAGAAGALAARISVNTVNLAGVEATGRAGTISAASADTVIGRRRRTRRRVRRFPDPVITAPESAPAYVEPEAGLPLLADYRPPTVSYTQTLAALQQLEAVKKAAELQRDMALYRRAEARRVEMEALAAKKRQDEEDDEAAIWLLVA